MISMAIGVTAGLLGSYASYKDQEKTQKQMEEYNALQVKALVANYGKIAEAEAALHYNSVQDSISAQVQNLQAKGSAEAATSALGIAGGSLNLSFLDLERKNKQTMTGIDMAREDAQRQLNDQAESMRQSTHSSLRTIEEPSIGKALVDGVQVGLQAYGMASGVMDLRAQAATVAKRKLATPTTVRTTSGV